MISGILRGYTPLISIFIPVSCPEDTELRDSMQGWIEK